MRTESEFLVDVLGRLNRTGVEYMLTVPPLDRWLAQIPRRVAGLFEDADPAF
ncbi:MAG: hypothetical protein WD847_19690 [Pirellulales bacterium]